LLLFRSSKKVRYVCVVTFVPSVNVTSGKAAGLLRVYAVKKKEWKWKFPVDCFLTDGCVDTSRRNKKYMLQIVSVLHRSISPQTDMKYNTIQ